MTLRFRSLFASALLACLALPAAWAELTFDQPNITIDATPEMEASEGVFTFTNTGKEPVTIESVHASCGCTAAKPDKKVYAPGESGSIQAVFTFGERSGPQTKIITVMTSEGNQQLQLTTNIPPRYEMKPAMLMWVDADRETKSADVRFLVKQPVEIVEVVNPDGFAVDVVEVEPGAHYRIEVAPSVEPIPNFDMVTVVVRNAEGRMERLRLSLRSQVRRAPTAAK